jgi:hypothetical protein
MEAEMGNELSGDANEAFVKSRAFQGNGLSNNIMLPLMTSIKSTVSRSLNLNVLLD